MTGSLFGRPPKLDPFRANEVVDSYLKSWTGNVGRIEVREPSLIPFPRSGSIADLSGLYLLGPGVAD